MSDTPSETHSKLQPLVLAVVNTRHSAAHLENVRFEIEQPRCVVGSGKDANLAIEKAGLDRQHCEFVRNSMGTYVRNLGDSIAVNGQNLPEAWIYSGDVLTIGDIDLRVEALGRIDEFIQASLAEGSETTNGTQPKTDLATLAEAQHQSPEHQSIPNEIDADWKSPTESAGDTSHRPSAEDSRSESADIVSQSVANDLLPASDTESQWVQQALNDLKEFEDRQRAIGQADDPPAETNDSGDVASDASLEMATESLQQSEEAGLQNEWIDDPHEEDHAKWLDELYDAAVPENELVDDQSIDDLNTMKENLGWMEQREPNVSELIQPGNNPADTPQMQNPSREETEQLLSKIESTFNSEQEAEMDTTHNPTADSFTGPQENRNESVAEVLARMQGEGKIGPIPTDENAITPDSVAEMIAEEIGEQPQAPQLNADIEDDSSVQDYMSQLFNRLRTDDDGSAATTMPTPSQPATTTPQSPPTSTAPIVEKAVDDLTPANPFKPNEFKPSGAAPEKTTTLDALRQVANQSVSSAIRRSVKKKKFSNSISYLIGTGVAFFLSSLLFLLSQKTLDACFIGGILFAVACAASGFMFVQINMATETTSKHSKVREDTDAEPTTDNESN